MRMIRRPVIVIATMVAMTMSTLGNATPAHAATPKLLFGAYVPPAPHQGMDAVTNLEAQIKARLDIVLFYQAWGGVAAPFRADWINAAGADGRNVLLTWEPWVAGGGPNQPAFSLSSILLGTYDSYIRSWAAGVKTVNKLVYLRPMHEMNGNWYPWGGTVNGNTPAKYVAAWRRIVNIFRNQGVTNVRWVWSPYSVDVPSTNKFESFYPGSSYVNVIAIDGYNWGGCQPTYGGWLSFERVFAASYARLMRMGTYKPIWIGETSSAPQGGDKAQWVKDMFTALRAGKFPFVKSVVWFSDNKECDWRATNPTAVTQAIATGLAAR